MKILRIVIVAALAVVLGGCISAPVKKSEMNQCDYVCRGKDGGADGIKARKRHLMLFGKSSRCYCNSGAIMPDESGWNEEGSKHWRSKGEENSSGWGG